MTYLYEYFSFPQTYSVICPNCGAECSGKDVSVYRKSCYGGQWIKSHFLAKEKGSFQSNLLCLNCGLKKQVTLNWPEDAYWKCVVKGKYLWAWSRCDAEDILQYISSNQRNSLNYQSKIRLLHLPKHFKLSKNRGVAIKSLSKLLKKNT